MSKQAMSVAKGIGIGMISGAAALAVGSAVMKKNKNNMKGMKKSAGRAVHTVSELLGGVESMLR